MLPSRTVGVVAVVAASSPSSWALVVSAAGSAGVGHSWLTAVALSRAVGRGESGVGSGGAVGWGRWGRRECARLPRPWGGGGGVGGGSSFFLLFCGEGGAGRPRGPPPPPGGGGGGGGGGSS